MDSLEELEHRKKELLLRKEIAKLEASERMDGTMAKFSSWWVVAPLGAVGAFWFLLSLGGDKPAATVLGLVLIVAAVILRVRGTRRR